MFSDMLILASQSSGDGTEHTDSRTSAATVARRNTVMVGKSSLNGSMGLVVRG